MSKINLDKAIFLKKVENAIDIAVCYGLDFDWANKNSWLALLSKAKDNDEEAYSLLNPYFFQDFHRIINKNTSIKRVEQIKQDLQVFFDNIFESKFKSKGLYKSFYNYENDLIYRISDHRSCPKCNYILINKKIWISLGFLENQNKYDYDIVIDIPNFFNIERKKQALFLILKKNKNLIYETILRKSKIIKEPYFCKKINSL
jgi:hypothetical protein